MTTNLVNAPYGRSIIFDNVITNVGAAYNQQDGIFTAPVNGTYFFTAALANIPVTSGHDYVRAHIKRNNQMIAYIFAYDANLWDQSSGSAVVYLVKGDHVLVEEDDQNPGMIGGGQIDTTFAGFLIKAD